MTWALFEGLPPAQVRAVLSVARRRKFARGEVVFHEGDPGDALHLVERGHVAVKVTSPLGDSVTLRVIGPGQYFGELALISPAPRNATIIAIEVTETLVLRNEQLDQLRREHVAVERVLLDSVVAEVRRLSSALLDAMYVPAPKRMARRLLELTGTFPADARGRVVIPLTQDDLAGLCGTTRPTVNQELARLVKSQTVQLARGRVEILDLVALTRLAR